MLPKSPPTANLLFSPQLNAPLFLHLSLCLFLLCFHYSVCPPPCYIHLSYWPPVTRLPHPPTCQASLAPTFLPFRRRWLLISLFLDQFSFLKDAFCFSAVYTFIHPILHPTLIVFQHCLLPQKTLSSWNVLISHSCPSLFPFSHPSMLGHYHSLPPCHTFTHPFLFALAAKSLSNRCHTHSVALPSVQVCLCASVCWVCVIMCARVCVCKAANTNMCASVEKAWPRLIATSYLVVTGLIKDDELTVGLSLWHAQHAHMHARAHRHTHWHTPLVWQKNR